jgi:DNA-binding MarR family transcriptional regulator
MIRIVTTLEGLGLLTRTDRPSEGRARAAQLTAEGQRRLLAAGRDVAAVDQILRDSASETNRTVILAWLVSAAERLEAGRAPRRQHPPD